jgi:hypothetical protein
VHVYYQEFKFYMYRCDIKEFEESTRNMFFNGLNPDIKVLFTYIPHSTIGIYVRACSFEKHIHEKMLDHSDPFNSCTLPPVVSSNISRMNIIGWRKLVTRRYEYILSRIHKLKIKVPIFSLCM